MTLPEITNLIVQVTTLITAVGALLAAIGAMRASRRAEVTVAAHEEASAARASATLDALTNPLQPPGTIASALSSLDPDPSDGIAISPTSKREFVDGRAID